MEYLIGIAIIILIIFFVEYAIKKPDQIVLYEKNNQILIRKGKFYPRHFSMAIQGTTHSALLKIESEAKGKITLNVKVAVTVAACRNHISELIKVGGWDKNAITNTSKELEIIIQGLVREFTEKYEIEELTSEKLSNHLNNELNNKIQKLGLEIVTITVQSIEPSDDEIANAMRQQESARIKEENEKAVQKSRISAEKIRIEANEQIALSEHELEMKKKELKKAEEEKEAELANFRTEEELKRKKLNIELEREEVKVLKDNPELLMLSPQAAKLAEASQNLKNAKTVVSISPNDLEKGSNLINMFGEMLQSVFNKK